MYHLNCSNKILEFEKKKKTVDKARDWNTKINIKIDIRLDKSQVMRITLILIENETDGGQFDLKLCNLNIHYPE